jgi:penicillin-binding protein 1A
MPRRRRKKSRKSAIPSRTRLVLQVLGALVLVVVLAGVSGLAWLWPRCSGAECPSVEGLRNYTPPQASRVFDREGELLAHLAPERRILVGMDRIPPQVSGAFLAVEDKRFFRHSGIDHRRVIGSVLSNARTLRFTEGFSTITMQLARNVFPEHLSRAKTLRRKLWEVMIARRIERTFTKQEILELYLNQIYLGDGLYGVEAAAQGYFGKTAMRLTTAEAAMLAALPKAPNFFNPRRNPERAIHRRNVVLSLMRDAELLTAEEAAAARAEPLRLTPPPEVRGEAPFFVAAIRDELRQRFGPYAENDGLRVYATIDRGLQRAGERALREQIESVEAGRLGSYRHPSCSGGEIQNPEACLQGLFTAVDVHTGDVLALVGGRSFALSQFDRVRQARRQSGSAFKPFVFAAALGEGIPITTTLVGPGAEEYDGDYVPADHVADTANVDMREAMRLSSNRAAVALGERVGIGRVVQVARGLGLTTDIPEYPSTVLGAADVVPLEFVAAYATFANGGELVTPRLITRVEDGHGRVIWESRVERRPVLSPEVAFLTLELMKEVVDRGTGSGVRRAGLPYGVPAAGKTGTTNESADAWFVGVTPEIAAGVWIGFDRPQRIMRSASGGGALAAPVWGRVMAEYYQGRSIPAGWTPPLDLVAVDIDRETGFLAGSMCPTDQVRREWFLRDTEPTRRCPLHPEPGVEGWFQRRARGIGGWINRSQPPAPATPEPPGPAPDPVPH